MSYGVDVTVNVETLTPGMLVWRGTLNKLLWLDDEIPLSHDTVTGVIVVSTVTSLLGTASGNEIYLIKYYLINAEGEFTIDTSVTSNTQWHPTSK